MSGREPGMVCIAKPLARPGRRTQAASSHGTFARRYRGLDGAMNSRWAQSQTLQKDRLSARYWTDLSSPPEPANRSFPRSARSAPPRNLDGAEAGLVADLGLGLRIAVVADGNTWSALGRRVARALQSIASVDAVVLSAPHADEETLAKLTGRLRHAEGIVAVGTGTINDLCKAVSAGTGRPYAVFGTAASMNGYTTGTVSLLNRAGVKITRRAVMPKGLFLDLEVLRQAPIRLTRAGLGDSICRTTAQFDWLLSHLLHGTEYTGSPYLLQEADEQEMFERAPELQAGGLAAYAALARVLILTGIGTMLTGTTQYGSGSEHLVSHAIDMLAGDAHPGSLHGEQTGIATLSMARLQSKILASSTPPYALPIPFDEAATGAKFGAAGPACAAMFQSKIMDRTAIRRSIAVWRNRGAG